MLSLPSANGPFLILWSVLGSVILNIGCLLEAIIHNLNFVSAGLLCLFLDKVKSVPKLFLVL